MDFVWTEDMKRLSFLPEYEPFYREIFNQLAKFLKENKCEDEENFHKVRPEYSKLIESLKLNATESMPIERIEMALSDISHYLSAFIRLKCNWQDFKKEMQEVKMKIISEYRLNEIMPFNWKGERVNKECPKCESNEGLIKERELLLQRIEKLEKVLLDKITEFGEVQGYDKKDNL